MLSFSLRILKITHHFSTQSLVNFARLFCQRWRLFITSTTSKDATVESFSGKASAVFLVLVTLNRTRLTVLSVYVYRCYPGPWRVLRKVRSSYICLHEQESMPSLKEVALDILPFIIFFIIFTTFFIIFIKNTPSTLMAAAAKLKTSR